MKSRLSFYVNLLLKLSLSQSILIKILTSWVYCLWGGFPCQHIPTSISGSSVSLVAAWWEKMLPLRPWCSVSSPQLSLVSFRTPCSWDIPRGRSRKRWDRAIFQTIQYSLYMRSRELRTSRWGLALQSSQYEPLPHLAETRDSGFQHQVSATPVPEMCEAFQCSGLNLPLLPCLPRLRRNRSRSPQKMLHHTKQ